MTLQRPTALIADDEPLLRDALERMLAQAWPELNVVAQARNGREAVDVFEALRPDVCFLDVHMPGMTGVEAARHIGRRAHLVFITAYDQYAVQAFAQGVLDYLVKPVEPARLAETVARLQERLRAAEPALNTDALIQQLAAQLQRKAAPAPLRWIRASVGSTVRLIPVDDIDFLRSEEKYTLIAWRGDAGQPREAVIRTPLKELVPQLDASQFAQVHRSVVVNLRSIAQVTRNENETADIQLKGRDEVLPVSRSYLHLFRQM
jgi:DNA-binding LytR/AlgR family response regulator